MSHVDENIVLLGNCLDMMTLLPDHSVDLILADLPYGVSSCSWDSPLPLDDLWAQFKRLMKEQAVVALTASQPFTSTLIISNPQMFKHEWIWIKNRGSNFTNTMREPMKEHESVLVFAGKSGPTTNKCKRGQEVEGAESKYQFNDKPINREGYRQFDRESTRSMPGLRVPSSWQKFNTEVGLHPTQKTCTSV